MTSKKNQTFNLSIDTIYKLNLFFAPQKKYVRDPGHSSESQTRCYGTWTIPLFSHQPKRPVLQLVLMR